MAIIPVPTRRSTELLMQTRLLAQAQTQQLEMLRLQDQLSTGYRIQRPSDDAPAASRAIRLQTLLERKTQATSNLRATQGYLAATDNTLSSVAQMLNDVKGLALAATNSTTPAEDRAAAVAQIRHTVDQLVSIANRRFGDRYLFAGSRSAEPPLARKDTFVEFRGNSERLPSFVDLGVVAQANATADEVFGVYSPTVRGIGDYRPTISAETRLSDLNDGRGVTLGSFTITDGAVSSTVDISRAVTVGDVVRLIESNPPPGRELVVRLTSHGLSVDLVDDEAGGNLRIMEVAGGTTAAELGIRNTEGTGTEPLIGSDIGPRLLPTTRLSNILGTRASGVITLPGSNNNLLVEARQRGAASNGITVQFVDDSALQAAPGLLAGDEYAEFSEIPVAARAALTFSGLNNNLIVEAKTGGAEFNGVRIEVFDAGHIGNDAVVSYDADQKILSIGVDTMSQTQVQTVIQRIGANTPFNAYYDPSIPADGGYVPTATISSADAGVVTGNTGNSGGDANTVYIYIEPGSTTAARVLDAVEAAPDVSERLKFSLDPKDTVSDLTAGQGPITITAPMVLAGGEGIEPDLRSGLRIENGGKTYTIDLSTAETIEDVLNLINGSGASVLAEINASGNGIDVRSRLSGANFSIGENGGTTATDLGLRSFHAGTPLSELNFGRGVDLGEGPELTIRRSDGVELDIELAGALTVQDVLNAINHHPHNTDPATRVTARLAQFGNGIELINEQFVGPDRLTIVRGPTGAAWDLGLVPRGQDSISATAAPTTAAAAIQFPEPFGINSALRLTVNQPGAAWNDIAIEFVDSGSVVGDTANYSFDAGAGRLTIDIDASATTAGAIVAAFAGDPTFSMALDTTVDPTNDGSGLVGFTGLAGATSGGTNETIRGADPNPQEVHGVFNTLLRLATAVEVFDVAEIERTVAMLEDDLDRVNFSRAAIGAQGQFLDVLELRLQDEEVEVRNALAIEIESDLIATISNLSGRQAALQAAMRMMGRTLQISLVDYI